MRFQYTLQKEAWCPINAQKEKKCIYNATQNMKRVEIGC